VEEELLLSRTDLIAVAIIISQEWKIHLYSSDSRGLPLDELSEELKHER